MTITNLPGRAWLGKDGRRLVVQSVVSNVDLLGVDPPATREFELQTWEPATGRFARNESNRLDCDVLVMDETSMVDVILMHSVLKAVPPRASLILVGDVDQLPSVGPVNCAA